MRSRRKPTPKRKERPVLAYVEINGERLYAVELVFFNGLEMFALAEEPGGTPIRHCFAPAWKAHRAESGEDVVFYHWE